MPVVSAATDPEALTLTLVADLAAPPTRVWQVWADRRQLERWWGPPSWPATVEEHDFTTGGRVSYYMSGPEGEKARGWWEFVSLDEPHGLEFEDGFADDSGTPNDAMPVTRARVILEATATGTRMTIVSQFSSLEQLEQLAAMGMVEGITEAGNQIDAILAA